jgi:uncharacterized membrane protein
MDRAEAQARLNRIRAFQTELDALEREGVVSLGEVERRAIVDHQQRLVADLSSRFDVDRDEGQRRMSVGMRIASVLGALALSAALVLFFYRIWGWLTIPAQVAVLISAPLVGIALTETAHRKDRAGDFTLIAALIACAGIVLNLYMAGEIFAITASPHAFIVWAAFGLAIGLGYGLRVPLAAGLVAGMVGVAGELTAARGLEWDGFLQRPELWLPGAAIVTAAGTLTTDRRVRRFLPTTRGIGIATILLAFWILSLDGFNSLLRSDPAFVTGVYQILGFSASAATIGVGLRANWPELVPLGAIAFVIFLYTKFYQWFWDWMPAYLFFVLVGLVAILAILILRRLRRGAAA